jgi:cytochrome P450 family 135
VISAVARKLTEPATIGGYSLPAGTFVLAAIIAIHHRDDLYPQPSEFRPERFLEGQAEGYTWIPFGGGLRRCLGAAFAQYEMKIVLRAIVERADLRPVDPRPERLRPRNITLAPARGARVVLDRPPRASTDPQRG